jgi:hypothetical protein
MKRILTDKEMEALEKSTAPVAPTGRGATFSPAEQNVGMSSKPKVISDSEMAAMEMADSGDISKTESALRGAAQGATFGFADELQGGALGALEAFKSGGAMSFREAYESQRDAARQKFQAAQMANPMSYLGGQVAGGIAGSALTPGAGALGIGAKAASVIGGTGKAASLARGVVQAGASGAASGGLTAAGESEAKDLAGIASDVGGGAAAGGAFGGVLGGGARLLPGVRGSVSNEFFAKRVLPVTVGPEGAKTAEKFLKSPDARNQIVALANKDTIGTIKDEVKGAIQRDVDSFKKAAGEVGQSLLDSVEDKMGGQLNKLREAVAKTYAPAIERLDPKRTPAVQGALAEIDDVFSGKARRAMAELGEGTGVAVKEGNAQSMREVRDIVKQALYKGGNPRDGIKDNLNNAEVKILKSLEAQTQKLFKEIPEAKLADELYTKASDYTSIAQKNLFKKGAGGGKQISNAAVESFVLGKGTAGKVEDLDRMFDARKDFVKALTAATGKAPKDMPEGALNTAREIMDFNRLGGGDNTGRSLAPLLSMLVNPKLAPFAMAAYNPRMYLKALAQADNLTAEDRKVLGAIVKAVGRQRDIAASKFFSTREGEE